MNTAIQQKALARHRESAFSRRIMACLDSVEIRPAITEREREEIFRFRYGCYRAFGHMDENPSGLVRDEWDEAPGVMLFGLWHEGRLVSSIRFNRVQADNRASISRNVFPEVVEPLLDGGATIIDPTRFTICRDMGPKLRQLPYATVRLAAMASIHFGATYAFALIRETHGAFYRKVFGSTLLGEPRSCAGVNFKVCLYATHIEEAFDRVFEENPFFHSLPTEREALFGPADAPLTAPGSMAMRTREGARLVVPAPPIAPVSPTALLALAA